MSVTGRVRRVAARIIAPDTRAVGAAQGQGSAALTESERAAAVRAVSRRMRSGRATAAEISAARRLALAYLAEPGPADVAHDPAVRTAVSEAFTRSWLPRSQPVAEPPEPVLAAIRDQFHRLYYHVSLRTWKDTWYRGVATYKCPTDMWVYQELVDTLRPGLVVETGTFRGGSALFLADRLELAGRGEVVSIDIDAQPDRPDHPRLTYLTGSSLDDAVLGEVRRRIRPGEPVMVILDSDHRQAHVAAELRSYGPLVTVGSYLIVEDTNVNGHPAAPDHGAGPWEAVHEFLATTDEFIVDSRCERYFLTQNPAGYLKRVRPGTAP